MLHCTSIFVAVFLVSVISSCLQDFLYMISEDISYNHMHMILNKHLDMLII
jgi:hypothetical protein